jgi:hypothetical protein
VRLGVFPFSLEVDKSDGISNVIPEPVQAKFHRMILQQTSWRITMLGAFFIHFIV